MKLDVINSIKPQEWISLASGLVVAGAIYALLIYPAQRSLTELPALRKARAVAGLELVTVRQKLDRLQHQIAEDEKQLQTAGGGPPSAGQKDLQIARVTALADRHDVVIEQYLPLSTVDHNDHRAYMVEFTGAGSFLAIQALFAAIERQLDFVDVTNFAIEADRSGAGATCVIHFCCRINAIAPELIDSELRAKQAEHLPSAREVVWHES